MNLEALRREGRALIDQTNDEYALEDVISLLREARPQPDDAAPAQDELVSFDADGRGYTAQQLGDTLDERVRAMRRGEGKLSLEEYLGKSRAWKSRTV